MSDFIPTIGLEIHAELKTRTKMFCSCLNDPDEKEANKNICPVCMAHPGTLPVINREAVRKVLLVGTAVDAQLAREFSEFDRKNYFYPDIPKGYQISQYKYPLVSGGELAGVALTRIHLEEDTARSIHDLASQKLPPVSLVDYNRAGVPLMELVTEPVIHDAQTAGRFARELQLLLRYLGAGEANMEKGEMRVEANISVSKETPSKAKESPWKLGTKVEVKNLNSFRSVERAIAFEVERQTALIESGGAVVQETRGWDEEKQVTFPQRKKESSHDYRYFPDPDLPKLVLSDIKEFSAEQLKSELPELPWERRKRYKNLGIKDENIEMYVRNEPPFVEGGVLKMSGIGTFFEKCLEFCQDDKELIISLSNYLTSDVPGVAKKLIDETKPPGYTGKIVVGFPDAKSFTELIQMFRNGEINSRSTKDVLEVLIREGGSPQEIVTKRGLAQQSDEGALTAAAQKIIDAYPQVVADYKAGKEAALQFLVGQGMKETKGSANPGVLRQVMLGLLK